MAKTGTGNLKLEIPSHQSFAIGPMALSLQTDGEMVLWAEPEVGFLHRGIEKIAERTPWQAFIPYADRVDYLASIHSNLAYALAVEALAGIVVPERASLIRIIVSELNRMASHLLSLGRLSDALGLPTGLMYALRDREKINNLFETLSGARLTYSYIRIGGVAADVTEGFVEKTYELVEYLVPKLKEYYDLLSNNQILMGRLAGVGVVSSAQAIECGISGPILRAAGVKHDVRKDLPYSSYQKLDFDVPVGREEIGTLGDAFDRHMVRIHEIEQAASLIKQALDLLPDGGFCASLPRVFQVPKGEAYCAVESPRGTLGVYISSEGEKAPARLKFRTPSFPVLNLFPTILEGVPLGDLATVISSLDLMISEVDR